MLELAGLVVVRRDSRKWYGYLNPEPIQEVYDRWWFGTYNHGHRPGRVCGIRDCSLSVPPNVTSSTLPASISYCLIGVLLYSEVRQLTRWFGGSHGIE